MAKNKIHFSSDFIAIDFIESQEFKRTERTQNASKVIHQCVWCEGYFGQKDNQSNQCWTRLEFSQNISSDNYLFYSKKSVGESLWVGVGVGSGVWVHRIDSGIDG